MYDGVLEYFVTTRERVENKQEHSVEQCQRSKRKAS